MAENATEILRELMERRKQQYETRESLAKIGGCFGKLILAAPALSGRDFGHMICVLVGI